MAPAQTWSYPTEIKLECLRHSGAWVGLKFHSWAVDPTEDYVCTLPRWAGVTPDPDQGAHSHRTHTWSPACTQPWLRMLLFALLFSGKKLPGFPQTQAPSPLPSSSYWTSYAFYGGGGGCERLMLFLTLWVDLSLLAMLRGVGYCQLGVSIHITFLSMILHVIQNVQL